MSCLILVGVFVIMWSLELLADLHPFPGIWWTHRQAMDYGGLVFVGLFLAMFFFRRE